MHRHELRARVQPSLLQQCALNFWTVGHDCDFCCAGPVCDHADLSKSSVSTVFFPCHFLDLSFGFGFGFGYDFDSCVCLYLYY